MDYAIPKGLARVVSSKISSTTAFVTLFIIETVYETVYGPFDTYKAPLSLTYAISEGELLSGILMAREKLLNGIVETTSSVAASITDTVLFARFVTYIELLVGL